MDEHTTDFRGWATARDAQDGQVGSCAAPHAHGLLAKISRSRRWRTTRLGRRLMATAIQVREINFPQLLALAA